jgi:hypothetical protein
MHLKGRASGVWHRRCQRGEGWVGEENEDEDGGVHVKCSKWRAQRNGLCCWKFVIDACCWMFEIVF